MVRIPFSLDKSAALVRICQVWEPNTYSGMNPMMQTWKGTVILTDYHIGIGRGKRGFSAILSVVVKNIES